MAQREEFGGRSYQSKAEARYARDLSLRLAAREIRAWSAQWPADFVAPSGARVWRHLIDFRIEHLDGSVELVEIKGLATEVWMLKRKVLELVILPALNLERPTRYTVLGRGGEPWQAPKRRATLPRALAGRASPGRTIPRSG